jgi:hypothetical protein
MKNIEGLVAILVWLAVVGVVLYQRWRWSPNRKNKRPSGRTFLGRFRV